MPFEQIVLQTRNWCSWTKLHQWIYTNQLKETKSLHQLEDQSPIWWQPVINLPAIQILKKEPQTAVSLSFEFISVVYLVHQLDDCPHLTIPTHKWTLVVFMIREDKGGLQSRRDCTLWWLGEGYCTYKPVKQLSVVPFWGFGWLGG